MERPGESPRRLHGPFAMIISSDSILEGADQDSLQPAAAEVAPQAAGSSAC